MFKLTSRAPIRSLTQVLTSKSQPALAAPEKLNFLAAPFLSHSPYSNSPQEDPHDVVSLIDRDPSTLPRLFVVQPRLRPENVLQAKLDEALNLAYSLEDRRHESCEKVLPHHVVVQNPTRRSGRVRSATFFGPGTVDNIKCHLNAVESKAEVDAVFVNAILSGGQQRNLERIWNKPVLDRVGLIIEIFNAHAQTKEAKLQAELAALMYKKSRLVRIRSSDGGYTFGSDGAEVVSARGRGSGGRGFISGAGETELQLQRRRILERRSHLLTEVEEVRRTRAVQRSARKKDGSSHGQGLATVAVVGYTNAGKSTLVSALSHTYLYSDDRLFATVDPRLRSVLLPSGRKALLSDTVGFISELPTQLVEAFHATLEEVVEADLLVHVLDSCAPNFNEQRSTVLNVLEQIGVSKEKLENMIEVWNKIDLLEERKDATECMDDGEASSFSGGEEDSEASDVSTAAADDMEEEDAVEVEEADFSEEDDDDLSSQLIVAEPIGDCDDSNVFEQSQKTPNDEESKSCVPWMIAKPTGSEPQHAPHVKTSALKKVGLQELLEIIDEKLKTEDEKLMPQKVGGRDTYDKKWRPPRTENAEMAAEQ